VKTGPEVTAVIEEHGARPPLLQALPQARLTLAELALEAETTPERVRRLVEINAIAPGPDGSFDRGDVIRARVVGAFESEGFSLDQMATAIRERAVSLDSLPLFYPDPSPRTGRTYGDFAGELGPRGEILGSILSAMGLSAPAPDAPTRGTEEALLTQLIEGWSTVDDEYTLRAARIFGDAARRAAEGWVALFGEGIAEPVEANFTTIDEVVAKLLRPAAVLSPLSPKLLAWLLERHLERAMNDYNIGRIERRLEGRGLIPTRPEHPPAVAFVDMSGFTRMTLERGDEHGARTSVRLGELADEVVDRHGGRVLKLLGDGVLLLFPAPCPAIEAVAELARRMLQSGLPIAHAGIHAGPVVERDGDVFGTTVNMASRIANHAPAGTILVSEAVVEACPQYSDRFEPLGEVAIRGLAEPVTLCRWRPLPLRSEDEPGPLD
jgi:adenylate cyclase